VGGQRHAPAAFLPTGKTPYPLCRRLGGHQGRSGQVRKISLPPGFDPRTVQPVASRYIDYTTRATQMLSPAINNTRNGDRAIYIITSLRAGQPGNRGSISSNERHYFSSLMSPGCLWVHPTSYSNGNAFPFPGGNVDGVRLTTQIHTMHRLKISGSIPPRPICFPNMNRDFAVSPYNEFPRTLQTTNIYLVTGKM
jgi:hypothetical protein